MDPADNASRVPGRWIPFQTAADRRGFQGTLPGIKPTVSEDTTALVKVAPFNTAKFDSYKKQFDDCKRKYPDFVGYKARPSRLEDLLDSGPSPREYKVAIVKRQHNYKPVRQFKIFDKRSILRYLLIPIDLPTSAATPITPEQLGETVRRICEHVIGDLQDVNADAKMAIRYAALRRHGLEPESDGVCVTAARYLEDRGRPCYATSFPIIHPGSRGYKMRVKIDASRVIDTIDIPRIPEGARLITPGGVGLGSGDLKVPASVILEERFRHEKAANLSNYIAYMFAGSYSTWNSTAGMIKAVESSFLTPATGKARPMVARVNHTYDAAYIRPGRWAPKIFPDLPRITVRSPTFLRTYETMQAMLKAFEDGGHVLDVWRRGAEVADIENQRIDRKIPVAHTALCREGDGWHIHPCHSCNLQPLCFTMSEVPELNMRVCHSCSKRPVEELRQDDNQQPTTVKRPLLNLTALVLRDYKRGIRSLVDIKNSAGERMALIHKMRPELAKQRITGGWRDWYCSRDISDTEVFSHFTVRGRRSSPFDPSVDAVCLVAGDEPLFGPHVPSNVVVTAFSLNNIKSDMPALVLKALAQYRRSHTNAGLANAFKGLMVAYILRRMTRSFNRTTRMPQQERRDLRQAWVLGRLPRRPRLTDGLFNLGISAGRLKKHGPEWRPELYEWLIGQYEQIPSMYDFDKKDRELWMIQDAGGNWVPYPFDPQSKLFVVWSWWHWDCWTNTRLTRTDVLCNQSLGMDCDKYTYGLCLMHSHFQKLQADRRRLRTARAEDPSIPERRPIPRDGLGICPVPWIAAGNSASVAHKHHNSLMTSGFEGERRPQDQTKQFHMNRCNISLDSYAWNVGVMDFTEDLWPGVAQLLEDLREGDKAIWPPGDVNWDRLNAGLLPEEALQYEFEEVISDARDPEEDEEETALNDKELEELAKIEAEELAEVDAQELVEMGVEEVGISEGSEEDSEDLDYVDWGQPGVVIGQKRKHN